MLPGFDLPGTCLSTSESTTRFLWACLFYFWRQGLSIHSCGCPETCSVEKADLKLTEIHFSTSRVLGLKAFTTIQVPCWILMSNLQHTRIKPGLGSGSILTGDRRQALDDCQRKEPLHCGKNFALFCMTSRLDGLHGWSLLPLDHCHSSWAWWPIAVNQALARHRQEDCRF